MDAEEDISDDSVRVPFLVKLGNPTLVKKIISAKRRYKKLEFSKLQVENEILDCFRNQRNFSIFINESPSRYHYNLLKLTTKKLKTKNNFKKSMAK